MTESSYDADHYVHRLDLGEDPFKADFISQYFYSGAGRRQLLDQLVHFGRFGEQIVVLVGATGSGTSTLLDKAYSQLEELMDCCFIDAEEQPSEHQILVSLTDQLNLDNRAEAGLGVFLAELRDIATVDGEFEPILLVVDQAHYMSLESFALLRDIEVGSEGLIHLILAGEYQVEQLAVLAGFTRDRLKRMELEPLSRAETGEYITGLLQSVGYAGEQALSNDQLAVLYERAGGNFIDINQLAPKLLSSKPVEAASKFSLSIPVAHIAAIAILAVALLAAWFYQGGLEDAESEVAVASERTTMEQIDPALPEGEAPAQPANTLEQGNDKEADSIAEDVAIGEASAVETDGKKVGPDEYSEAEFTAVQGGTVQRSEPDKVEPEQPAPSELELVAEAKAEASQKMISSGVVEIESPDLSSEGVDSASSKSGSAGQVDDIRPVETEKVASKAELASKSPAVVTQAIPARERRILEFPENGYVIQLMGALEEARVKRFVQQYAGRLPLNYFETRLRGKPWYVVVTGPYVDKQTAREGVRLLPEALQRQKPWPRSVAGVHADIRVQRVN